MTNRKPYTPDSLADRWECSPEKVRQMVKCGELRGFRIGRKIRIPGDAVEEFEGNAKSAAENSCDRAFAD